MGTPRTTFVIATNGYEYFAINLLTSLDPDAFRESGHKFLLLTDASSKLRANAVVAAFEGQVELIDIPSYGWPDATIRRFELMAANWDRVSTPYVGYVDADMVVRDTSTFLAGPRGLTESGLAFVAHPGYFRANFLKRLAMALPPTCIYENRHSSTAFVPVSQRFATYVCGGQWLGGSVPVRTMVEELAARVQRDNAAAFVARNHDESHINRYRHEVKHVVLDPSWAYSGTHGKFRTVHPIVEVVEKPYEWFAQRDSRNESRG